MLLGKRVPVGSYFEVPSLTLNIHNVKHFFRFFLLFLYMVIVSQKLAAPYIAVFVGSNCRRGLNIAHTYPWA